MNIPLTHGAFAVIDDADYHLIEGGKWILSHYGYAVRSRKHRGRQWVEYMHRLILGLTDPRIYTDHIDRDKLNNSRSNLRACTSHQNQGNRAKRRDSKSQHKGVRFDESRNRWRARIRVNSVEIALGRFQTEAEAALAYNKAAVTAFGEFARLNEVYK